MSNAQLSGLLQLDREYGSVNCLSFSTLFTRNVPFSFKFLNAAGIKMKNKKGSSSVAV